MASFGRMAYGGYGGADPSFCRAAWCAVVHGQPDVAATGVAGGVTLAVKPRAGPGVH
jgi:hypothetical protein